MAMRDGEHESGSWPRQADTVVIGGGTAGAAVAGLLAERSDQTVLLLEAGPDYGPLTAGRWPGDLLDARALAESHQWGYDSALAYATRRISFERAKVIGGCSAHNGCAAIWGHRLDYDGWVALGNPGWSADELLPVFRAAAARLRVRAYRAAEITPFQAACLAAAPGIGLPLVADLNDLDGDLGMAASPVNIHQGVRWNTAFAYLDPVRHQTNLTIRGESVVDRLIITGGKVTGVAAIGPDGPVTVATGRVVVAAGTYGSPAILLRSGIGDPEALLEHGITPTHSLPGVGENLHDHPSVVVDFAGSPDLERRMTAFAATTWMPEEQTIAKARSADCTEAFDLHLYPVGGPSDDSPTGWRWKLPVACLTPRSRGSLRLASADPTVAPIIDHRYLSDPDGADRRVLADGVALARALAAQPALRDLIGAELGPGSAVRALDEITAFINASCVHYYHPVGTCMMGPASDSAAVVDARGQLHGLDGVFVADAAIMPVVPRANTNLPALVIGERIAGWLLADDGR